MNAVRAVGGTVGQRVSEPGVHRPLSADLYDSESLEEYPELQAEHIQLTTHLTVTR